MLTKLCIVSHIARIPAVPHYDVEIVGPVRPDPSWQFKAGLGFDATNFVVDWDNKVVTCPQGHNSTKWLPRKEVKGQAFIDIRFLGSTCRACPVRSKCTQSKTQPRELSIQSQARQIALQSRRQQQQTPEWKETYKQRAGIEATHSQGIRRSALRRSRYIGLVKTHLQHILIATALNLVRLDAWLSGIPFAKTRSSRFKQLQNTPC